MTWTRFRAVQMLALGTASALLLAACNGDDDLSPTPDAGPTEGELEDVTLTVAYWDTFGLEALVEEYQDDNPHVTIELASTSFSAHHDSLQQSLIEGFGAAHITAIDERHITRYVAQSDDFVNLLDYGAGDLEERFLDWKWDRAATADRRDVIGFGAQVGGLALCYRADLFEAAGLPSDRETVNQVIEDSWDGFIALGEDYVEATDRAFIDNAASFLAPVLQQAGVSYYNRDHELEVEATEAAFDVVLDMLRADLSAGIAPWTDEWNDGFSNGDFAVVACPSWMTGHIQTQIGDNDFEGQWDIADLPGPGGNLGGTFYTIPDQFDPYTTEQAYAFLEWLMQPEQQLRVFREVGTLPSQAELYSDPGIQNFTNPFFNDAPVGVIFSQSAADIPGPAYYGPRDAQVRAEVEAVLAKVQAGELRIRNAWEAAVEAAEAADNA